MGKDEIISLAKSIKKQFTNDTFKICKELGIEIKYTNLKPNVSKAFIIQVIDKPVITLNNHFTTKSQKILCAHELGHALMHSKNIINQFGDNHNGIEEYEANLFAVALLFEEDDFNISLAKMDNYLLKGLLDDNLELTKVTNENSLIPIR